MGPEAGGQLSLQGIGVSVMEQGSMENLSQNELRFILLLNIAGVPCILLLGVMRVCDKISDRIPILQMQKPSLRERKYTGEGREVEPACTVSWVLILFKEVQIIG